MKNKFTLLGILCLIGFTFASCTSTEEKKNSTISNQTDSIVSQPQVSTGVQMLENKLIQDSLNIELRAILAANYYSAGELTKAAYHYLIISGQNHKNIDALKNLGNIYYDSHEDDKAIQFYERALQIEPENINMKCDLATCYSRINKLKKATEILRSNIKADPKHAQSHHNLSVILDQSGQKKEAAEEMKIYKEITEGKK